MTATASYMQTAEERKIYEQACQILTKHKLEGSD